MDYLSLLLEAANAYRFDESLDVFRQVTQAGTPRGAMRTITRPWIALPYELPLFPAQLTKQIASSYQPSRPDYTFGLNTLDFLSSLVELMGFAEANLRIDVNRTQPSTSLLVSNMVFRFIWNDGTSITHEQLSYGQKRLLTFFYYLACNPQIVIADELVNGLHHRWIASSIEAIANRQAFLTSQNPLLFDYIPITSEEEVQRSFVLCRNESHEGRPAWIWENMTDDDAHRLFQAYEVGIEHVSEILQSRGLW